jgi:thiol-disulfide isomerase/thioredoxin
MSNTEDNFINTPVAMLEMKDFDKDGTFIRGKTYPDHLYMVMCYANWCPPCKQAKPHYIELANALKEKGINNVFLTALNATPGDTPGEQELVNEHLYDFFGAKGFPSFLFFKKGKKTDLYKGERTVDAFLEEIKRQQK